MPHENSPAAGPGSKRAGDMRLLNAMYYFFKPMLPQSVRYTMRRLRANHILRNARDWPVMASAGAMPDGWPGWPEGKDFAVILTHDVEGPLGLERCMRLLEMEAKLGFRSSFNLIPEGSYRSTEALRDEITRAGFEVGVHDLHHDGSLFRSWKSFEAAATRINTYLHAWKAAGFRAGFMFHNLEWIKALDIEYDASTFDTDPFEPQPDGMGTIFPFWVEGRDGRNGYVEMPYTLPQDATLYLILREKDISVWKHKTAWLARHGGMVHLNVHPDYLAFDGGKPTLSEFNAGLYEEFLLHLREHYQGRFWNPLPREVARFYKRHRESTLIRWLPADVEQATGFPREARGGI